MPTAAEKLREKRLREVLGVISERREFRRQEVSFLCSVAKPQFVSRVLNQLAAEGILYAAKRADDQVFFWAEEPEKFAAERWIERQLSGAQVTKLPADQRPRERLLESGTKSLAISDLLAILIRSGTPKESAVQAGQRLAKHFEGRLETIVGMSKQELRDLSQAVNISAYCSIMAGIELGRRIESLHRSKQVRPKLNSTAAAVEFCASHFARLANEGKQEEFHIVTLDTKLQVIHTHQITVGTLDASLVHPREVFRQAIRDSASSILLVHNHPSGDPTPSRQDRDVTERLRNAGELLGVRVIDHVIVARGQAVSLAEHPG